MNAIIKFLENQETLINNALLSCGIDHSYIDIIIKDEGYVKLPNNQIKLTNSVIIGIGVKLMK